MSEGKTPLNMGFSAGPALSPSTAFQQSRPLKLAPKPTSRLCNRKPKGDNGVPIVEKERELSAKELRHFETLVKWLHGLQDGSAEMMRTN